MSAPFIDRLRDCLPKVNEPETLYCMVDTADLRTVLYEMDSAVETILAADARIDPLQAELAKARLWL